VPSTRLVAGRFALLTIPGMQKDDQGERRYLRAGMAAVQEVDKSAPCGWIVDLRSNGGGNMWPMIAVLAPLLGEGKLGSFVFPGGTRVDWELRDGQALLDGSSMTLQANTVMLAHPDPPVAVLTSEATASAGEASLIAFRGLNRARTFGRPTAGFATSNETFSLSDGAVLVLTTALDADRTGHVYGNDPIPPDLPVPRWPDHDAAVGSATSWLNTQPACR
jgi:carboxyl-terminal processing protease